MDDFSKLPAPPKGQTGITPDQFAHLPPPPRGQKGMTLAEIQGQPPAQAQSQGLLGKIGSSIGNAFKSGVGQIKQGIQQGQSATNPLQAVESGVTAGAGIVNTALSPLAPVFSPINKATNAVADKISNVPAVQNFAMSKTGQNVARGAEDLGNLATIAGASAGAVGGEAAAPKVADMGKTAIDTAVGSTKGALETRKATAGLSKAYEAVTPNVKNVPPKMYQQLLSQQRVEPKTALSPAKYILSDSEKAAATKYQDLLKSKDVVQNSRNVINDISKKDAEVGKFLDKNNAIFNSGELKNHIIDKLQDVTDVAIPEDRIEKLKNTLTDGFIKALPKNDMKTLWEARKSFDTSIKKVFNGSPTLQNVVKREFRNSIQDFISERTPDKVYQTKMKDMRELFDLHDNLAIKAKSERSMSGLQKFYKDHKTAAKIVGTLGGLEIAKKFGVLP